MRRIHVIFAAAVLAALAPVSHAAPKPQPSAASVLLDAIEKDYKGQQQPNLRQYAERRARYLEAEAISSNAYDLARARIAHARFEGQCAMDGDAAKWRKAEIDAFNDPALSTTNRLRILRKFKIHGVDVETDGWKIVEGDPALYKEYFDMVRNEYRWGPKELDERTSYEHRIELMEKAMELVTGDDRQNFAFDLADAMRRIGKFEDGEQVLLPWTTNENKYVRAKAFSDLSRYYSDAAKRYYSEPNRDLLLKALDAADKMIQARALFDQRLDDFRGAIGLCFKLGDYDRLAKYIDAYVATAEKRKQKMPDGYIAAMSGDRWYYLGNYEEAVKAYSSVENLPSERTPENTLTRYAGALYATGRYDDCLKIVGKLHSGGDLRERNNLYSRILDEKLTSPDHPVQP